MPADPPPAEPPTVDEAPIPPVPSEPARSEPLVPETPPPRVPEPQTQAPQALPELTQGRSARLFRVYYGDYTVDQSVARLRLELEVSGSGYVLRSTGEAEGLMALFYSGALVQESRGQLGLQGLAPLQYVETRGSRRQRSVRFDHETRQLVTSGTAPVALPEGTQDRLSVLYQLGLLVQGQAERFTAGAVVDLPVASFSDIRRERLGDWRGGPDR